MTRVALVAWCLLLIGCNESLPAVPFATEPAFKPVPIADVIQEPVGIWPDRIGNAKGVIVEDTRPISNWRGARVPNDQRLTPYPIEREQFDAFNHAMGTNYTPAFEPGGGYVVIPYINNDGPDGKQHLVFYSAVPGESEAVAEVQRTWFTYDEPDDAEPIGLAVLMPGIFAKPRDVSDRAERGLLIRGWAVLRMLAPPSRMTERTEYTIDSLNPDLVVSLIAADLDNRAAEAAYAVQAGAEHVLDFNSDLVNKPRVIIGMSGTAIALPTIVAYEPEKYDAAVLIGGGALSYMIALDSSYRDWIDSIQIYTTTPGSPGIIRAPGENTYDDEYAGFSKLDGVHTGASLVEIPVLMIHGSSDTAVPADYGDLLWRILDEPERWTMPVGHELLFGAIPFRMAAILDWLEANTKQGGEQ
jgi:hypothetical protein